MFRCHLCDGCFSDEGRRDEHLWLCSLRQPSSMCSFLCHCCNRQFDTEECRNSHEFLCCLKMPPGSCFICKFCGSSIAIYNHSSFVHHEKHWALNLASAVASSVLCRNCSKGAMVHGFRSCNIVKKAKPSDVPICVCSVDPDRCVVMWSRSSTNLGRVYYCGSKFSRDERCNFFQWCD